MKRRREIVEKKSEIKSAIEELSVLVNLNPVNKPDAADSAAYNISTLPFLSLCSLVLQVLDKIGPTMAVLRQDINQNIHRLEKEHETDPSSNSNLVEILKKEAREGNARKTTSCSRAFVWLTRSLDFAAALLQKLLTDPGVSMEQAVEDSYDITLKQWHRWISSAAFKVALKLVPENKTFMNLLMVKDGNHEILVEEIQTLISLLLPFLEEIHSILRFYGLDRLKST